MSDKVTMARCKDPRLRSKAAIAVLVSCLLGGFNLALAEDAELRYVARDSFYDPPSEIPGPGTLLRSEPLKNRQIPEGAQAWRFLYATTFADGSPATAVATVLAPAKPASGPRPVVMWLHGTYGLSQKCMPSLYSQPFAAIPALHLVLEAGWVLVVTDYATAGRADSPHEYLIGEGEARSGLDSVRAARQLKQLTLDRDRTVAWGFSQGGGSALWTGIVGPRYAPDVKLAGVVAIAPGTDTAKIVTTVDPKIAAIISWYLAASYSSFYPDVKLEESIDARAIESVRRVATLCTLDLTPIFDEIGKFGAKPPLPELTKGALGQRVKENNPTAPIAAPLLVAQGLSDDIIQPSVTDSYVQGRCAAGQTLDYWLFPAGIHQPSINLTDLALDQPLAEWTRDRFAGKPQPKGCHARAITD
jgi:dienelactone hydrolase